MKTKKLVLYRIKTEKYAGVEVLEKEKCLDKSR